MKARQTERLLMHLSIGKVLREHVAIINMVPAMMRVVQKYDKLLENILVQVKEQTRPLKDYAKHKKELRIKLASHASYLSNLGYSYGLDVNCCDTMVRFGRSYSNIYKSDSIMIVAYCTNIYDDLVLRQDVLKEYGVKKKDVEELHLLIKEFRESSARPQVMVIGRKISTRALKQMLDEAGSMLKKQLDKMMPCYSAFPEFMKAYKAARIQWKYKNPKIPLPRKIKAFYEAPVVPVQRKRKKLVREMVLVEG